LRQFSKRISCTILLQKKTLDDISDEFSSRGFFGNLSRMHTTVKKPLMAVATPLKECNDQQTFTFFHLLLIQMHADDIVSWILITYLAKAIGNDPKVQDFPELIRRQ